MPALPSGTHPIRKLSIALRAFAWRSALEMATPNSETAAGLFASLRHYRPSWLSGDLIAALTLAAIAIPEQLATARLAGMPPSTGLLAFLAGTAMFAAFGTHRVLSAGADSTIAPIMASALAALAVAGSPEYASMAALLGLLTGLVLIIAGLARAGAIVDLLSIPVTTGFLAGISIHIIAGQAADLLGVAGTSGDVVQQLANAVRQLPHFQMVPAAIGLGVLAVSLIAERITRASRVRSSDLSPRLSLRASSHSRGTGHRSLGPCRCPHCGCLLRCPPGSS